MQFCNFYYLLDILVGSLTITSHCSFRWESGKFVASKFSLLQATWSCSRWLSTFILHVSRFNPRQHFRLHLSPRKFNFSISSIYSSTWKVTLYIQFSRLKSLSWREKRTRLNKNHFSTLFILSRHLLTCYPILFHG